jgi:hypothetical protein
MLNQTKGLHQMTTGIRTAFIAAFAAATLVFTTSALAANSAKVTASTTGTATTLHFSVPQTTDPIAQINIFVPAGYTANLSQAAGANIGAVDSTALAHDGGLTLPLTGPVTTDSPAAHTSDVCSPATHAAVWNLNLSVAGSTLVLPLYVDPTSGAATALGAYQMLICLPPWDVPVGTPGRAFEGAQLLDAKFTVNNIFTAPTSGLSAWHTLFTPYTPGMGTPNLAGTFEARALAGASSLSLKATKKKKKKGVYAASGSLTEGGLPVAGMSVALLRGSSATKLAQAGKATTGASGAWSTSGKLTGKKPVYFKATATAAERDATSTGCATPLPATVAPGGCVSATLAAWTVSSPVAKLKP